MLSNLKRKLSKDSTLVTTKSIDSLSTANESVNSGIGMKNVSLKDHKGSGRKREINYVTTATYMSLRA